MWLIPAGVFHQIINSNPIIVKIEKPIIPRLIAFVDGGWTFEEDDSFISKCNY